MRALANEKGVGLITAVATLLILSLMAVVLVFLVGTETFSVVHQTQSAQSSLLAEAGAHRALTSLSKEGGICFAFTGVPLGRGTFTTGGTEYQPTPTTLSAAIDASTTTIPVTSTSGYAPYGRITIDAEPIDYTAITATSFTGARRGANNTTAAAHTSGASVNQHQATVTSTGTIPSGSIGDAKRVIEVVASLPDWTAQTLPPPISDELSSVSMVSATDAWAVGKNGVLIQYDGTGWSTVTSPTTIDLNGVTMVSATDGWTVGGNKSGSAILHYDGTGWSTVTSPTTDELNAVSMVSATDGWAVGKNGVLIQYDGTSWSTGTSPTTEKLNGVTMVSATDGWAVGTNGALLDYDGTSWNTAPSPTCEELKGVSMRSATDGWAVGKDGTRIHYDGTNWSYAEPSYVPPVKLSSLFMLSATDGWAVGDKGTVLRYDGTSWSPV
ncbi:MAG: hypothetical protein V3W05_07635, partial [candidate division NC10 bacterium]